METMPAMVTAAGSLLAQVGQFEKLAVTLGEENFRPVLLKTIRYFPGDEEVQRASWAAMQPITASVSVRMLRACMGTCMLNSLHARAPWCSHV